MPAFLLACAAAWLTAMGGRDQQLAAHLSARLGRSGALLAVCLIASLATAALAVAAGWLLALVLHGSAWPAVLALLLAAAQLARPLPSETAREPTRSLFAIALVLVMRQAFDAPRLIILAAAAFSGAAFHAALGGALGAAAALAIGWAAGPSPAGALPGRLYPWPSARLALAGLAVTAAAAILLL